MRMPQMHGKFRISASDIKDGITKMWWGAFFVLRQIKTVISRTGRVAPFFKLCVSKNLRVKKLFLIQHFKKLYISRGLKAGTIRATNI